MGHDAHPADAVTGGFEIEGTKNAVGGWSRVRPPFEPKGEVRAFRDQLRAALRRLDRRPVLHAEYASADTSRCDVENVTLYNVGSGAFAGLGVTGLVIERSPDRSPPAPSGARFGHFVGYRTFAAMESWRTWRPRETLLRLRGEPVGSPVTAASVWASLRRGMPSMPVSWKRETSLGMRIRIESRHPVRLVANVKALIDGGVAAAHVHDGSDSDEVMARLAEAIGEPAAVVGSWLRDDRSAVLGQRRLVHRRGRGVQWNPEDDGLVAIEVIAGSAAAMTVSIELLTVDPVRT